jgi:cell division protein YceG involved in septum cleavage
MSSFMRKLIVFVLVFVALLLTAATFAINYFQDTDQSVQGSSLHTLRIQSLQMLIDKGFDRFITLPFGPGSDFVHLT